MQIKFKNKLLQYFVHDLASQNDQQGAIWLKLIFGLIFLGGAFIFLLPYFLGSVNSCGKNSHIFEARQNMGTTNRAQQAYYLEYKTFAKSFQELQVGIKEQSENYTYTIKGNKNSTFHYAIARRKSVSKGWLETRYFKSYVGAVFINPNIKDSEDIVTTISITCETKSPGTEYPPQPTFKNGIPSCGVGTKYLGR